MRSLIKENADVLSLNSITAAISFSAVEELLQIVLLVVSILYTVDRYVYYRNKRKNKN